MQLKTKLWQRDVKEIYQNIHQGKTLSRDKMVILKAIMEELDQGRLRVSEFTDTWKTQEWIKQAIIAYIHYSEPKSLNYGMKYRDHTAYKYDHQEIEHSRVVPTAYIRFGAYIGHHTIIMPSFINTGAYIGHHTMIDTYASIGCCAQIGNNVHISAGSGIGGVLEPLQANPTIIEDNCFIGARSEISEGVIVKSGAVLASGCFISQSTRIYNRLTDETTYGVVPKNAVIVPGTIPSPNGKYNISAVIIVKFADQKTREKTKINTLLRSFDET
jgi:2,3,4,5-tetrahydropyridine-2-carboxylate N-succinyltransferase